MKRVSVKMLQKSVLCGFKGMNNFLIGAIIASNGAVISSAVPGGGSGPNKIREGLYAMYKNLVPVLEVLLCMGVLCVVLERIVLADVIRDPWARTAAALAVCMVLMMLVCTLLRVTDKRRDCCNDYDYGASFDRKGGYGMHFSIPGDAENRNMLTKLVPSKKLSEFFAFDTYVPGLVGRGYPIVTPGERALHCFGALMALPFWVLMLALNLFELPIVAVLDCAALCTRSGRAHAFAGSRDVVSQMLYGIYQVMEPITCVLQESAQGKIGGAFHCAVRRAVGMHGSQQHTGHSGAGGPGGRLESVEVGDRGLGSLMI